MRGKLWRAAAAVAGSAALILGLGLAAAGPAAATQVTGRICTFNGSQFCLFAANYQVGTPVVSSSSQGQYSVVCAPQAGTSGVIEFCGGGHPTGANAVCAASPSANSLNVTVQLCSGTTGTNVTNIDNGDGSRGFEFNHWPGYWLAGDNVAGDIWTRTAKAPGWYWRMHPLDF